MKTKTITITLTEASHRVTARTVALTPHTPDDLGAWYGHGMSADVEGVGAGAEFTLDDGGTLGDVVVVWRYSGPDSGAEAGHRARLEQRWGTGGRHSRTLETLGRPSNIGALARAVSRWLNRPESLRVLRADRVRVTVPDALPFPGSY